MTKAFRKHDDGCFLQVAQRLQDVYYQTDTEGRVTDVGTAYGSVWLHEAPALIGRPWFHAVHAADRTRVEQARERLLVDGRAFDEEYRVLRGDGETRWIRDRAFHFEELGRIAGIAQDVTDSRQVAAGHEHAEKLQTLGLLATSIAHDFGNLIQGVTACLDLAVKDSTGPDRARQYVKEASVALRGGAALTKQLTGFSRKEAAAARPLALDAALAQCASVLRHLLGTRIDLSIDLHAPGSYIWGQQVQIEQILLNLAANARDAMPAGGVFRIATRREASGPSQAGPAVWAGSQVRLEVVDSGRGMDAETRTRMFEPFFTTKPLGQGTGLGLAVVQAVTAALRGQLQVESAPGLGTGFVFCFPEMPANERPTIAPDARAPVEGPASDVADPPAPSGASAQRAASRTTGVFRRGTRG